MPTRPELLIEDSNGDTRATITCLSASRTRSLVEPWQAVAVIDRADWLAVEPTVDEIGDKFYINRSAGGATFHGGRFADDERDADTVRVVIDSPERDAEDAEPTGGRVIYQSADDSTVFTDAINNVASLTTGTVQTGVSTDFSFSHAPQSKVARAAAEPAGQDVAYRNDWTVDFLTRLGSDKPSTTISNASQNTIGELSVDISSKDPATHIRGLGAQHGPDQVQASATIPSYSSGRKVWRIYTNKEITQQTRLQEIVDRLATEWDSERRRITVNASVLPSVDVSIGDSPTVTQSAHDIDRLLRITKITEQIGAKASLELTLTNRKPERGGSRKLRDDVGRFNVGDQGFIDRDIFRAVERQPVDSSLNATGEYDYPSDVEEEILAEITVRSIPYRGYSSGAASADTGENPNISHQYYSPGSTVTITSAQDDFEGRSVVVQPALSGTFDGALIYYSVTNETGSQVTLEHQIENEGPNGNQDDVLESRTTTLDDRFGENFTYIADSTEVSVGDNISHFITEGTIGTESSNDVLGGFSIVVQTLATHTHNQDPGVVNFPSETASGVDVKIGGSTVATDIGSGTFTTTVDISGEFTPGVNPIELVSDSTGFLSAYVQTQTRRRGRTSP